jgi:pimeloyl-ACP methyl ester carboxylesterase
VNSSNNLSQEVRVVPEIEEQSALVDGPTFAERQIEADGFQIRLLEAGEGAPVVYFHGGGGLHPSPGLGLLARRFRVHAFELPGFGRSPANTRTQSLDELADTMTQAIDAVGLQTFALLGTSLGGALALRLALSHPDRVETLILESPSAFRSEDPRPFEMTPEQLHAAIYAHPENAPAADPPEVIGKQVTLLQRLIGPTHDAALEERVRGFGMSTLVLFGTRDGLISPQMGRTYKELMPNCSFVLVYDAAHEIAFDRPEAYANVVGDFIERQEAFVVNADPGLIAP